MTIEKETVKLKFTVTKSEWGQITKLGENLLSRYLKESNEFSRKTRENVVEFVNKAQRIGYKVVYNQKDSGNPYSSEKPGMILRKVRLSSGRRAIYVHEIHIWKFNDVVRTRSIQRTFCKGRWEMGKFSPSVLNTFLSVKEFNFEYGYF